MKIKRVQDLRIGKVHILYGILYPVLLLILSILMVNQGVDLADSMYSLSSDRLFGQADGNWTLFMAYYLANFVGFILTKLPFGHTLIGMNLYTSLIIYASAMVVYVLFGKRTRISYDILFLGEVIALCFQWCPSTVLYNFLSYLLWTIALYLLREGLVTGKNGKLCMAGVILGLNVFTKFTNITAGIFILMVIYWAFLNRKDSRWFDSLLWKRIGICVAGFVGAFFGMFLLMELLYGRGTYLAMMQSLFGMTDTATDYQMASQFAEILYYYRHTLPFLLGMIIAATAGMVMLRICSARKGLFRMAAVVYVLCIPVLFRLFYGRGLFGVNYEYNFSVVLIGALFCWITILVSVITMLRKTEQEMDMEAANVRKMDACMILCLIFITPLGSNNGFLPVLNNMYLIVPITISLFLQLWKKKSGHQNEMTQNGKDMFITFSFTVETMFAAFLCLMLIQGILFHANYTFNGQDENEKRDTKIENNDILFGMKTNSSYAKALTEMFSFAEKSLSQMEEPRLLTYGYLPGVYFVLDASPVLSTTWPDLDSFSVEVMQQEMDALQQECKDGREKPLFLVSVEEYQKMRSLDLTKKEEMIITYLDGNDYQMVFQNERYLILQ